MNENNFYDYTAKAAYKNRTDITLSVTCYIASALLYIWSVAVEGVSYVSVMQFFSLLFIVFGVFVNQRYTWSKFVYRIKPVENKNSGEITGHSFLVYKLQGKKSICLADIPARDCIALYECKKNDKKKAELSEYENPARYSFTQTLLSDTFYTAVFKADGGIAVIRFEPDDTFVRILSSLMSKKESEQ